MGDLLEDAGERKIYGIIYVATNVLRPVKQKQYVGKTKRALKSRWYSHVYSSLIRNCQFLISKAIRKWKPEAFTVEQIDIAYSQEELNEKEIYWIKKLDTLVPNGYNVLLGGTGALGYKHTPEFRSKLSSIMKGRVFSEETRAKMSKAQRNKKLTTEHKENISIGLLAREPYTTCRRGHLHDEVNTYTYHRTPESNAQLCLVCFYVTAGRRIPKELRPYLTDEDRSKCESWQLEDFTKPITCKRGHLRNEANVYVNPNTGRRHCKLCMALSREKCLSKIA